LRFHNKTLLAAISPLSKNSVPMVQIKLLTEQVGPSLNHAGTAIIPSPEKLQAIRSLFLSQDNELALALLKLTKTLERLTPAG
jgi:hypothetical protein